MISRRNIILALALFSSPFLYAQTQNKFDFTQQLIGPDGKVMQTSSTDGTKKSLTLGDVCVEALESQTQNDRNETGLDKFKRDELARKIYNQKSITLSLEEIKLIKDRIGLVYSPAVIGAAWRILGQ